MKSLQESLLDDEDVVVDRLNEVILIKEWLKKYSIENYKINKDNTIDIKGTLKLARYGEEELPSYIQFNHITHSFVIYNSKLKTLRGCPKEVGHSFTCAGCKNLTSLKGAPKKVGRGFVCSECDNLTSLKGAPKYVGGYFDCSWCENLSSPKGAPKEVGGNFNCIGCKKLKVTKTDITKICKVGKEIYMYKQKRS